MARNITGQITYCINKSFTEGTKKREYKMENGRQMGPMIFSFSEKYRLKDVANNLQNFLRDRYPEIKQMSQIRPEHIQAFINSKATGGCTQNTIASYIASLKKIQLISEKIYSIKLNWVEEIVTPVTENKKSKYKGVENQMPIEVYQKIENYIKDNRYCQSGYVILLQRKLGIRIEEITRIKREYFSKDRRILNIKGAKGGKDYPTRVLDSQTVRIVDEIWERCHDENRLFTVEGDSVNRYLGRVEDNLGLDHYTNHNIRAMVAQEIYDRLRAEGRTIKQALLETSEYLNHTGDREDMMVKSYLVLR